MKRATYSNRSLTWCRRASLHYDGTGIGLALVKKTCEKMGGQVGVCSEPGQGSRFWVLLQAAPTETVSETSALL